MVHDEHLNRLAHLDEIEGLLSAVNTRGIAGSFHTQMDINRRLLRNARERMDGLGLGARAHGR